MIRKFLFILLLLLPACVLPASARQPHKGYRGFLEWSNSVTREPGLYGNETLWFTGGSTSHGYQIDNMWFVGAGLSVEYNNNWDCWQVPLFVEGRTDFKFGMFTPFADVRLGYSLTDGGGVYFAPSVGYRFNWGRKMGVNVGVGLEVKGYKLDVYNVSNTNGYYELEYLGSERHAKAELSLRVGIDF